MSDAESVALMEENGKIHIVTMIDNTIKIKGIGVVNPLKEFSQLKDGEETHVGSKILLRLPTRLPELLSGMKRRAQTIGSKDAGVLIARHGIGANYRHERRHLARKNHRMTAAVSFRHIT